MIGPSEIQLFSIYHTLRLNVDRPCLNSQLRVLGNKLPRDICELTTLAQFKGKTFTYLANMDCPNHICTS